MRILCQNYEFPPLGGGGAVISQHLAEELCDRGHEVDVVTSGMSGLPHFERSGLLSVRRVNVLRTRRYMANSAELASYVYPAYRASLAAHRDMPFDVNHTHFALPSGVASLALKRKTGLPYVLTLHGSDVPGYNPDRFRLAHLLARPIWKQVVKDAAAIVSPSYHLKELFQRHIDLPVRVIPNGFAPRMVNEEQHTKRNRILVVSRMFHRKGVQYLLRALQGWDCKWEIFVVGDGPYLEKLRAEARRLLVDVTFTGYVQGQELLDLYASAKVFVFPSLQENFPTVLMEAMDAGCAIITTKARGCAEVVADAGVSVTPGSAEDIRAELQRLISNPLEIERLAVKSRRRIKELSWKRIAQDYEACLGEACEIALPPSVLKFPLNPDRKANDTPQTTP